MWIQTKTYEEKCLSSLVVREMQIKIKLRGYEDGSVCKSTCHIKLHWESVSLPSEKLSARKQVTRNAGEDVGRKEASVLLAEM